MNLTIDIVAIIAVLAPIIAGIFTYLQSRKNTDADVLKSDRVVAVEALQKAGDLAVAVATKQAEEWEECRELLAKSQAENDSLKIAIIDFKLRLKARAGKIRNIINQHDYFKAQIKEQCPGYEVIQGLLVKVAEEIEEEARDIL